MSNEKTEAFHRRKGRPRNRDELIAKKKKFYEQPRKDPLLDCIGGIFRSQFCHASMTISDVPKKTRKGYEPKIFFRNTVFEEMFYPTPPRNLWDIEEEFLCHPSILDEKGKVAESLSSCSNVIPADVDEGKVSTEQAPCSTDLELDLLAESMKSIVEDDSDSDVICEAIVEILGKQTRIEHLEENFGGPTKLPCVDNVAVAPNSVQVSMKDLLTELKPPPEVNSVEDNVTLNFPDLKVQLIADTRSDVVATSTMTQVAIDAESYRGTSSDCIDSEGRSESCGEEKAALVPSGPSQAAIRLAQEDIDQRKSLLSSDITNRKVKSIIEADYQEDSFSEEEEDRELTSHESDCSSSGSVVPICEVHLQKRVAWPLLSESSGTNISRLIQEGFGNIPCEFAKPYFQQQHTVVSSTGEATTDIECIIIDDAPACSDTDVIILSD